MPLSRILVADDDPDSRTIARLSLEHSGYEVITAVDGSDAIEKAREMRPDVILMDLQMPALTGFDAARALKADNSTAEIPIIAVTALSAMAEARECGFCGILLKPILPTDLATAVEQCRKQSAAGREWINLLAGGRPEARRGATHPPPTGETTT